MFANVRSDTGSFSATATFQIAAKCEGSRLSASQRQSTKSPL